MKIAFYVSLAFTGLAILAALWALNYAPAPVDANGEMPPAFGLAMLFVFAGVALTVATGVLLGILKMLRRAKQEELA